MWTLRLNLLEQCQYRCRYCLPGSLRPPTRRAGWLRADELARLGRLFHAAGVRKVRLTGGEPLLRDDVEPVLDALRGAMPGVDLALTTNGLLLGARLAGLAAAGLRRVTVHVDSLRPDRYRALMGDGDVHEVLAQVRRAREVLHEAKLNVVVQRGQNDDELLDFLAWGADAGVEVRFIELMNTGSARDYVRSAFVPGADIVARVAEGGPLTPVPRRRPEDPAALYRTARGQLFGLIASDTQAFCGACNRLRLLPDGRLRGCLYAPDGVDLGAALRAGVGDAELAVLLEGALRAKRSFHPSAPAPRRPFSMSEAGG